ncbi:MAG: hypothetical protein J0I20_20730 [Chloroflexi bacterium]|nr:hypothetical protein [Chloroflexota bacterium]OJV96612.1 MAG: hypothetical protein BGO39_10175 [Chloroflexi bacterium 54-19]
MPINRQELVTRHNVRLTGADAQSPLSVGNGEFAFTADITGLQTFPDFHRQGLAQPDNPALSSMQLGTQSQWGWHTLPNPQNYTLEDALTPFSTTRGPVTYPDRFPDLEGHVLTEADKAGKWLYSNPHRLNLGQVGLTFPGVTPLPAIGDLTGTVQTLDLWRGWLTSRFRYAGEAVQVQTVCHPELDLLAVRIESGLLKEGKLAVEIAFPYGSDNWSVATDWEHPEAHTTTLHINGNTCVFERKLDADTYYATLTWAGSAALVPGEPHHYQLAAPDADALEFVLHFSPRPGTVKLPSFTETLDASASHWQDFWQQGAAIDFSGSADPRAPELERRVVLSQYLTAINCAGSLPPQETGLVLNSWCGKFHLEMHWWHAVHFALWGRPGLLERSLPWYKEILPMARATAERQGYKGVRWPKQVGPDGREAPSGIGPFLIWQQPHPIYYAELLWRLRPDPTTLENFREIVFETAEFMASFPYFDGERYVLGSPLIPAQESYAVDREKIINPTFELAYWHWGLETAQRWRERLGLDRNPAWEQVKNNLARPTVRDGVYAAMESYPYTVRTDHPSMLCAYGMLPPTPLIDPAIMRETLATVTAEWDWPSTWGWDYPVLAMCAARLGDPHGAVDALLMEMPKNLYLPNGHNRQVPTLLPLYLPGNGGLLAAVAMLAAGWDGAEAPLGYPPAPGFPADGSWQVRAEGFYRMI